MKVLTTLFALLISFSTANAQEVEEIEEIETEYSYVSTSLDEDDKNMFNHMSLGINAGTMGVGLDVAMPMTRYMVVRAGFAYMPPVSFNSSVTPNRPNSIGGYDAWSKITLKNTPNLLNGKVMLDIYPAPSFPLHLTLGAYIGAEKILKITDACATTAEALSLNSMYDCNVGFYTEEQYVAQYSPSTANVYQYKGVQGPMVGSYALLPYTKGTGADGRNIGGIDSWIQTSIIRPYAGLGWGKKLSDKGIDFAVEAGVVFWGEPEVYSRINYKEYNRKTGEMDEFVKDVKLEKTEGLEGEGAVITKYLTKLQFYPVINFRMGFNLF